MRLGFSFVVPTGGDYGNELQRVARNLAHGSYSSPFPCGTGATAIIPPGYPALLAPIYRWGGKPAAEIGFLSTGIASATYAMLPALGSVWGLNPWTGVIAGLIGAIAPYSPYQEVRGPQVETLLTFLLVCALILTARMREQRGVLCGLVWGVTFLVGPQAITVFAALMAYSLWQGLRRQVLIASVIAALTVSPWIVRNYVTFGHLFWIRSGAGLEFYLSNNPDSVATSRANHTETDSYLVHPIRTSDSCRKVQQMGEVEYFNSLGRAALVWCRDNPGKFSRLTLQRIWYYWSPPGMVPLHRVFETAITLLGLAGACLWLRRKLPAAAIGTAVLVVFPLFYYAIQINDRYRSPIQPVILLGAAEIVILAGKRAFSASAARSSAWT
jgi:hypothetical protein